MAGNAEMIIELDRKRMFAEVLDLPTVWVLHSYAGCSQHAPNEHVLAPIMREGLQMMTGLFWDLAEDPPAARAADQAL